MLGLKGRLRTQIVAANIAGAGNIVLLEDIVSASVRTAGAQNGITAGQILYCLDIVSTGIVLQNTMFQTDIQQPVRQQLVAGGEQFLPTQSTPMDLTCSSMTGSSSSITYTLSTLEAKSLIIF